MVDGRVGVITGAGSGIGRSVAQALAKRGYRLVLAGRRAAPLDETAALVREAGGHALAVPTDVSEPASVERLFQAAVKQFDRVDLLFNNAGVSLPATALESLSFDQWREVIDVNLTGAFLCLQAAFAIMSKQQPQGGRIINNGSISAHSPRPDFAPYTASKHAVMGLTKTASLDGRKFNIACGQIDIGNAASDMATIMTTGTAQADGRIAFEPVMSVDHVGEAVAYMDSLPLDVNVLFLTIMATKMPFVGRG